VAKSHPYDRPLVRAEFTLPDGELLTRDWTMRDIEREGHPDLATEAGPPEWLENPSKDWPHPQAPITFRGTVKAGHEQDALAALDQEADRG